MRTRSFGRLARAAGFQGLLVPSAARPGGRNVVLFRDKVRHPDRAAREFEKAGEHDEALRLYREASTRWAMTPNIMSRHSPSVW